MKKRGTYKNFASFSLIYFWVEVSQKKCLYKIKKMYKKIEKSWKICLCMIKKIIFLPPRTTTTRTQKKTPSPKKKVRKEKKSWNSRKKKLKGTAQKRKTNRKNKITGLWNFFLSLQNILFHTLAYKNQCATLKKKNQKPKRIDK